MVERRSPKPTAEGSSPSSPANSRQTYFPLLFLTITHQLNKTCINFYSSLFSFAKKL